jgi:AcrR family transcriptional regulator
MRNTNTELAARTRHALEAAARKLFETRGFAGVSAEEIVAAAGVTRGALYHHYKGKEGLFEVVAEAAMKRLHEHITPAKGSATDAVDALKQGVRRFLELSSAPRVQRVLFIDAPLVMGWQRWRQMDARYGLGLLKRAVETGMAQGNLRHEPSDMLAHVLLSAMIETTMIIAASPHKANAREQAESVLDRIVDSFRGVSPPTARGR